MNILIQENLTKPLYSKRRMWYNKDMNKKIVLQSVGGVALVLGTVATMMSTLKTGNYIIRDGVTSTIPNTTIQIPSIKVQEENWFEKSFFLTSGKESFRVVEGDLQADASDSFTASSHDALVVADTWAGRTDRVTTYVSINPSDNTLQALGLPVKLKDARVEQIDGDVFSVKSLYDDSEHTISLMYMTEENEVISYEALTYLKPEYVMVTSEVTSAGEEVIERFTDGIVQNGSSGSAALALAIYLENSNQYLDEKVAITGDIQGNGRVQSILGVKTKVKQLIKEGEVTHILVPADEYDSVKDMETDSISIHPIANFHDILMTLSLQ